MRGLGYKIPKLWEIKNTTQNGEIHLFRSGDKCYMFQILVFLSSIPNAVTYWAVWNSEELRRRNHHFNPSASQKITQSWTLPGYPTKGSGISHGLAPTYLWDNFSRCRYAKKFPPNFFRSCQSPLQTSLMTLQDFPHLKKSRNQRNQNSKKSSRSPRFKGRSCERGKKCWLLWVPWVDT